jgi:hypothetical protein
MPLQSIIVVILRISALQLVVTGLITLMPFLGIKSPWSSIAILLIIPASAAFLWAFSE